MAAAEAGWPQQAMAARHGPGCTHLSSSGWTATAVSPSMVSGRVVATTISPLPSSRGGKPISSLLNTRVKVICNKRHAERLVCSTDQQQQLQEKTTPFGVNFMTSQVLHRAAQIVQQNSPRSCRVKPFLLAKSFSTTVWVAIPAWSVPGSHSTLYPLMRLHRTTVSWMALVRAWPRCREPVTFGGGITMTKGGLSLSSSGLKKPDCSHQSYLRAPQGHAQSSAGYSNLTLCDQRRLYTWWAIALEHVTGNVLLLPFGSGSGPVNQLLQLSSILGLLASSRTEQRLASGLISHDLEVGTANLDAAFLGPAAWTSLLDAAAWAVWRDVEISLEPSSLWSPGT
ncbi:MAG: hypothetical protein FRX49_13328 [Trebouxia sp. A1-2]|nr:MAG: hypothetical protein FRX49_13328 [Trebouxia sp. A1-2]